MTRLTSLHVSSILTFLLVLSVQPCLGWPSAASSSSSSSSSSASSASGRASQVSTRRTSTQRFQISGSQETVVDTSSRTSQALMSTATAPKCIQNFRPAAGIANIYRCASPDVVGEKIMEGQPLQAQDRFVLEEAGLVLDLRSPSERNEIHSKVWMNEAGMYIFESEYDYRVTNRRAAVRIDVLSPPRFMKYIEQNWFSPSEKAEAGWYKMTDGLKLHEMRIERLNDMGLAGLNEAILETGKTELGNALKIITQHLEETPDQTAVIHCVQGKDRTGMLVMLLQSLLGVSDLEIIADYFLSNQMLNGDDQGSAVANEMRTRGKIDRRFFSGTNEQAMISTLHFLRGKYGSVSPGYLDAIGFDEQWRNRLLSVMVPARATVSSGRL